MENKRKMEVLATARTKEYFKSLTKSIELAETPKTKEEREVISQKYIWGYLWKKKKKEVFSLRQPGYPILARRYEEIREILEVVEAFPHTWYFLLDVVRVIKISTTSVSVKHFVDNDHHSSENGRTWEVEVIYPSGISGDLEFLDENGEVEKDDFSLAGITRLTFDFAPGVSRVILS